MQLRVIFDGRQLRRWHISLLDRLARLPDTHVCIDPTAQVQPVPPEAESLFLVEALIHRLPGSGLSARIPGSELARFEHDPATPADVTLDLEGGARPRTGRALQLTFDGATGHAALVAAAIDKRSPVMTVTCDGHVVASGRLGTDHIGVARSAYEDFLARAITLIVAAIKGGANGPVPELPGPKANCGAPSLLERRGLSRMKFERIAQKAIREIYRLCYHAPHWRVGWRKIEGRNLLDLRAHPEAGWMDLPDDGRRFYADPFPIEHRGKLIVFVEDFEHRIGKGVISAMEMGPQGPMGPPTPVLETPFHLSYPFVFEQDSAIWMIPESSAARTIDLYRSTSFPGGWELEATLVNDIEASDATLFLRDGRWWMFATVRDEGGSFSDALHIWSAPDFRGPWKPHAGNPVLIDSASARPAGRMIERQGAIYRPVQDCRDGYGAALGIARIDRLDDIGYAQTVETILKPDKLWKGLRFHTLNGAGGFEFIDGSAFSPRWRAWI